MRQTSKRIAERKLFFSLWLILLLVFGIWKFWPSSSRLNSGAPTLELSAELNPIFANARLSKISPTQYKVWLVVNERYRSRLSEKPVALQLGFHLIRERAAVYKGAVAASLFAQTNELEIPLPNPEMISAQEIKLFLAY